jgi:N-dimethylarginine dimethylaminohydrolase
MSDRHQRLMRSAAEPAFLAELEHVWGERWGAWDEVGRLRRVLVRTPGDELGVVDAAAWSEADQALVDPRGGWYWTRRTPPQLDVVRAEHAGLVAALRAEGIEVVEAPPLGERFVKAMYVRDPLITVPGGAVILRMGVAMRRGEEPDLTRRVAALGMPILGTLTGTATAEGGSFVRLTSGLAAFGVSIRCNDEGARQLREIVARVGVELITVPLPGYTIHLDLHLAMVDVELALANPAGLPFWFLELLQERGIELIEVDPDEQWGVNALCLRPGRVLMADCAPRTAERLAVRGVEVVTVPYSEIHNNGGGIHCSTMELIREPAGG